MRGACSDGPVGQVVRVVGVVDDDVAAGATGNDLVRGALSGVERVVARVLEDDRRPVGDEPALRGGDDVCDRPCPGTSPRPAL